MTENPAETAAREARPQPHAAPRSTGSAWAPLAIRIFRALWLAQFASNLGSWMQTVGAQWVLIGHGAGLVTLVQVAAGVPVLLLALPAGVLADLVDRRALLLATQSGMAVVAAVLAVFTFAGGLSPWLLLGLTFLLGCGSALNAPAWQALQPSLVPREELRQASALGAVNQNIARAIGPAIGGALVALAGVGWTFAVNAVSFLGVVAVLAWWRPARSARRSGRSDQEREHAVAALRAGGRYVRRSPRVRRIMLRAALFVPGAAALWALLPVTAHHFLGLGSAGYGFLLGAVGVGAVTGATLLPTASRHVSGTVILAGSGTVFAGVLVVLALVPNVVVAAIALVAAGSAWIGALSTLNSSLQLGLPAWVRARGTAFYLLVFQGGSAVGSFVWGQVADHFSLTTALLAAAGLLLAGAATLARWPLRDTLNVDPTVSDSWPEPVVAAEPAPTDGPVLITVEYSVSPVNGPAFVGAMARVEASRRRTGATTWGLYQDAAETERFIETFTVRSWSEHVAQHHSRYTGVDHEFEADARALLDGPPRVTHALMFPAASSH